MEWVAKLLGFVASVAPGLVSAWTGHENDAKALEHLRELTDGLPTRSGSDGRWERDLEARRKRLARDKRAEDDTREIPK
jgi:hypothetical protein